MTKAMLQATTAQDIQLEGELNYDTVHQLWLESQPLWASRKHLEFNLAKVTHSDSAGLALLIAWKRQAQQSARPIKFTHIPAQMLAMAKVCGLEDILGLSSVKATAGAQPG